MVNFVKSLTIYPKLVLSFLLMIIPIYVSSLMMNQSGQDVVQKQISESMASRVHFYLTSLETELVRLTRLKLEYVNDDDLLKLGTVAERMNDFERSRTILAAKNKLYLLKSSSPFVKNVQLYIPSLGRSINANNFDDTIPGAELDAILDPMNMSAPIFSLQNRLLLSGVYPDAVYVDRQPVLAIEIELSLPEIERTLSSMASGEQGGGAAWVNADLKWQASSGIDGKLLEKFNDTLRSQQEEALFTPGSGQFMLDLNGISYFAAHEHSSVLNTTLAIFVPAKTVLQPLNKHRHWIWTVSLISLLLTVIFSYWIHRLIHKPIKRLIRSFRKVEKGDLSIRVYHRNKDEFHYLYNQFNNMLERIQVLVHEVYEQQIRSQQSELKQLQSQINPHFFYNSFFILQGLVRMREYELADRMFHHLGSYFQFITRSGAESVPLMMEMKHAVSYVEIQKIRFSGTVEVELGEMPQAWERVMVPRLIIQPIIENTYIYGLENKTSGGKLRIRFQEAAENELHIEVEDNGDLLDEEQLECLRQSLASSDRAMETTGMLNVHRRLQLKFGSECGLKVSRSELGGLKTQITIRMAREDSI